MTVPCSLQPALELLHFALFEHLYKLLAEQIGLYQFLACLAKMLHLPSLLRRQFLVGQHKKPGGLLRGESLPFWRGRRNGTRLSCVARGSRRQLRAPLADQSSELRLRASITTSFGFAKKSVSIVTPRLPAFTQKAEVGSQDAVALGSGARESFRELFCRQESPNRGTAH